MNTIDFNDNVDLRIISGSKTKILLTDLWIRTKVFNKRLGLREHQYFVFKIPKGSETDGASIPRILWTIISPFDDRILVPSQPHDYLYTLKCKALNGFIYEKATNQVLKYDIQLNYTRKEADQLIREKMKSYGGGPFLRFCVYWAVRLFGFRSY